MTTNNLTKMQIQMILKEWRIGLIDGSWISDVELSLLQSRLIKFLDTHDHEFEYLLQNDSLGG